MIISTSMPSSNCYWSSLSADHYKKMYFPRCICIKEMKSEQSFILSGLCYYIHVQVLTCFLAPLKGPSGQRRAFCRVITISTVLLQELDLSISFRALQETRAHCAAECILIQYCNISFTPVQAYLAISNNIHLKKCCHYFGFDDFHRKIHK